MVAAAAVVAVLAGIVLYVRRMVRLLREGVEREHGRR